MPQRVPVIYEEHLIFLVCGGETLHPPNIKILNYF